jgi:hypothetical protein
MLRCVRTTISISDSLLELAKKASRERRSTLGEVIEEALRTSLAPRPKSFVKTRASLVTFKGSGLREGVDLDSSAALLEVMES